MKLSLQDIAERAGVQRHRVTRPERPCGRPPQDASRFCALRNGYTPSMAARGLATSRTQNLGLITYKHHPQPISSYHVEIAQGIDDEARQRGYHVITRFVDQTIMQDGQRLELITEQRVDGLILVGPALSPAFIIELYNTGTPLVLVDNMLQETKLDTVVCDNADGTYQITRHLIDAHGLRRLAFFSGPALV